MLPRTQISLFHPAQAEAEITTRLYTEYRDLRKTLYQDLCRRHPHHAPFDLLQYAQIILDRVVFIAFTHAHGLLGLDDITRDVPNWTHFKAIFQKIAQGHEAEHLPAYPGSLFAPNVQIDELHVTDEMCREFANFVAADDHGAVTAEVLGHIFEQSITDLEELRGNSKRSRRQTEGIFYTPAFVTRYIVDQTLGRLLHDKWQAVLAESELLEKKLKKGSTPWTKAWTATYEEYQQRLEAFRVLDLSCGAGAFLIAAFDALAREYERVHAALSLLNKGRKTTFDLTKTVLNKNLFGVDVNAESVEIAKLSLWLEAAERGRKLAYWENNLKWGDSIVVDPSVWSAWKEGFDVVIGNPPYVRQELLTNIKAQLASAYRTYHGKADLFVYFFERGISVLKSGGRLGFVVTNKWLRSGYAEPLRDFLARATTVESIVDFGHAPIFPDADVFPSIVTLKKEAAAHDGHEVHVTRFSRQALKATEIPDDVTRHRYAVPQARFGGAPWSLEPPELEKLMGKVREKGIPLSEYAGVKPYYGIKTGCNEAFVVDTQTRNRLVKEDPKSAEIIKKYLRGQDINRWVPEWVGQWMLYVPWELRIADYPAVLKHLQGHRDALEGRAEVKAKRFPWYALSRYASDYVDLFSGPKIVYQVIQFHPAYAVDREGFYLNDKGFFLPGDDSWLIAVLNSSLLWWFNWRYLTHLKDEALTPLAVKMEVLPIAPPSAAQRAEAESIVPPLIKLTNGDEALLLERRLSDLVNEAYGLTPQEVKLLWDTAPPRMPFSR